MTTFKVCLKCAIFVVLFCLASAGQAANSDSLLSRVSWDCLNNASCVNAVKDDFVRGLQERRAFNFEGVFSIEPVGDVSKPISEGRGFVSDIFSENALSIPVGGLSLRVARSPEYKDYIEVSLEKPLANEGEAPSAADPISRP